MQWTAVVNPGAGRRRRRTASRASATRSPARAVDIHVTPTAAVGLEVARDRVRPRRRRARLRWRRHRPRPRRPSPPRPAGCSPSCPWAPATTSPARSATTTRTRSPRSRSSTTARGRASTSGAPDRRRRDAVVHDRRPHRPRRRGEPLGEHRHVGVGHRALRNRRAARDGDRAAHRRCGSPPNGDVWSGTAWLVAVGNTHCYGGGMPIVPTARLDDGRLDAIIVDGAVSRAEVMRRFPQMMRGQPPGRRRRARCAPARRSTRSTGPAGSGRLGQRRARRAAARDRSRSCPVRCACSCPRTRRWAPLA